MRLTRLLPFLLAVVLVAGCARPQPGESGRPDAPPDAKVSPAPAAPVADPTVRIGYTHNGGKLVMVAEGATVDLPPGPLTLEFFFDQPVVEKTVWEALNATRTASRLTAIHPQIEWIKTGEHFRWKLPEVPAKLEVRLTEVRSAESGRQVAAKPVVFSNMDAEPYLERVHVTNGTRERLMKVPPEIFQATPSPDGKYMSLVAYEQRADQHNGWWPSAIWVADLKQRTLVRAPMEARQVEWRAPNTLLSIGKNPWGQEPGWTAWNVAKGGPVEDHYDGLVRMGRISPDGKLAAFLRREPGYGGPIDEPIPTSLVLRELDTGKEQVIPRFTTGWYIGKGGDWSQWVAWSPDGEQIATLDPVEGHGNTRTNLVVFDRKTGQRRVVLANTGTAPWGARLYWSPTGRHIAATQFGFALRVFPLDGGPRKDLPGGTSTEAFWDPTGARVLATEGDWGEVFAVDVATGRTTNLGAGLPAGWDGEWAYVIRWAGSMHRFIPQMP